MPFEIGGGKVDPSTSTRRRKRRRKRHIPAPPVRRRIHDESRTVRAEKRDRETRDFPTARRIRRPKQLPFETVGQYLVRTGRIETETPNLLTKALSQTGESILNSPIGLYEAAKAVGLDTRDIATRRDLTPSRTKRLAKAVGKQVAEDVRHPGRNPGYLAMDVLTAASLGAGGVARAGAVGKAAGAARRGSSRAARVGLSPKKAKAIGVKRSAARAALIRKPSEGGSLLRAPAPGRVEIAPGVYVNLSRNALARGVQRARIKRQKKRPEGVMRGVAGLNRPRNLPERVGFETRRRERIVQDIERAPAEGLRKRARRLDRVEQTAVRAVGERTAVHARIAAHRRDLAAIEGKRPTAVLARKRLRRKIALLRAVEQLGLVREVDGVPVIAKKNLAEVYELARRAGVRREAILEELGLATREQLEARRAAPGRLVEGATYEKPTPAKRGKSPSLERAQRRVASLERRYEQATGRRERGRGMVGTPEQIALVGQKLARARTEKTRAKLREELESLTSPAPVSGGRGHAEVERLGSALSIARDELERAHAAATGRVKPTGLVGAEHVEPGQIYFPYGQRRRLPTGRAQAGTRQAIGIPRGNVLHGTFTGRSFQTGRFPNKAVRAVADAELEVQRLRGVLRIRNQAVKTSIGADEYRRLPERVRDFYIPVRTTKKPFSADTREFIDLLQRKLDEGEPLTRKERRQLAERADKARRELFPDLEEMDALTEATKGQVRFVDRRTLGGLNEPQQLYGTAGAAGTVADEINAAMSIAILFLKPAYAVPNTVGQIFLTLAHQGALAPWNMGQAVRLYAKMTEEGRAKVRAAAGLGLAKAVPVERSRVFRGTRDTLASGWSKVLDSPYRWPAFVHEARMLGYDTPAKIERLIDDEAKIDDLIEVAQRTRDAMLDYAQLSPLEEKAVRRVVFFFPFMKASATYTGRYVRDHPLQAEALVQLSREGGEKARRDLGPVPFYARGIFKVGEDEQGRPLVVNPRAAQLFESPVQFAEAVKELASGDAEAAGYRFSDLLSPAARLPLQLVSPHDPLGGYPLSTREALKREYLESLPQARLAEELRHPTGADKEKLYPTSRRGALMKFGVGTIYPRPVNRKELNARAAQEGRASLSSEQRAYRDVFDERKQLFAAAKRWAPEQLTIENGRRKFPKELRDAFNRKAAVARLRARIEGKTEQGRERELAKYVAEARLLVRWGVVPKYRADEAIRWARKAGEEELRNGRARIVAHYFSQAYLGRIGQARDYLKTRGATLD